MEVNINRDKFIDTIQKSAKSLIVGKHKTQKIIDLLNDLAFVLPEEVKHISTKLGILKIIQTSI